MDISLNVKLLCNETVHRLCSAYVVFLFLQSFVSVAPPRSEVQMQGV